MPHWLIKSAAQRLITCLPGGDALSKASRRLTGSLRMNDAFLERRLRSCRSHLDHWQRKSPERVTPRRVIELGTGAFPVVPLAFYLCGAEAVWTFDIVPWLSPERIAFAAGALVKSHDEGRSANILPSIRPERVDRLRELASASHKNVEGKLHELGVHTRVENVCNADLPEATFDLAISFEVLEYIPRELLRSIFAKFHRLLALDGVMSHYIDLRDEYSYFDRRLSPLNFLRYSELTWQWLSPARYRHQRLHASDYVRLLEQTGFHVESEVATLARPEDLDRVPLAPQFRDCSREDLLKLATWICASSTAVIHG